MTGRQIAWTIATFAVSLTIGATALVLATAMSLMDRTVRDIDKDRRHQGWGGR